MLSYRPQPAAVGHARPFDISEGTETLVDAFEVRGDWWLPGSPHPKVAGTLKFDPEEGARLELMGSLDGPGRIEFGPHPVVLGESLARTAVTLTGCSGGFPNQMTGRLSCDYEPSVVFRGSHFTSIDGINLNSLRVSYDCLSAWMQLEPIKESEGAEGPTQLHFLQEGSASHQLDGGTLAFHVQPKIEKEPGNFSIRARACVEFTPNQPSHYSDLLRRFVYPMQNLLSLAMDMEARPLSMEGKASRGPSGEKPVWISYQDHFHSMLRPKPKYVRTPVVFGLGSLGADATMYLRNWFGKADKLKPVCDLFFGVAHHPLMYSSLRFLTYCQALETYHRGRPGGVYMSNQDFADVLCRICAAIPEGLPVELGDSIRSRLGHSYEFSLRDRLRQIMGAFWPRVKLGFRGASGVSIVDAERLVDLIVKTRNALTHKGKIPDNIKDEYVWHASQLLKMLIECVLLTEMGMTLEQLREFVGPTRYLHSFDALAREFAATSEPSEFGGQ